MSASVTSETYYDGFAQAPGHHVGLEGVVAAAGVGYEGADVFKAPEGSDRGLSSGNPFEGLSIPEGSSVVDLGCGAGRDCFLASYRAGAAGHVVGIDASDAMVAEARAIAKRDGFSNVEFAVGNVLAIPLPSSCADFVLSNCVFNNVDDKVAAFTEVRRILKDGGTLSFSDVMTTPEASSRLAHSKTLCLARAIPVEGYIRALERAGFTRIDVTSLRPWPTYRGVVSAQVVAS